VLSIDEARRIQKERSEKALKRFVLLLLLDGLAIISAVLLSRNSADIRTAGAIILGALVALIYQIKSTRVYLFLTPKEFTGTVQYYDVKIEVVKDNLSHLPGDKYKTHDAVYGEMIVKDSGGRSKSKKFLYTEEYTKIDVGSTATILRFIDRPVISGL